ncbi:hypothetical protein GYMLUDRAFT_123379, partial [Collybiopsis luxurians FD-317 M1]
SNPQVEAAQKKAQEVFMSTQRTGSNDFDSANTMAGPLREMVAKGLEPYSDVTLYNLAVFREILKHVHRAEGLSSPSAETVRSEYRTLLSNATSVALWKKAVSPGEVLRVGIYGLEAYGVFKVRFII